MTVFNNIPTNKKTRGFAIAALAFTLVAIILRTVSLLAFFEADIGYYQRGAVLPVIFNILCGAAIALFIILPLVALKKKEAVIPRHAKATRTAALLPVAALAIMAWNRWQSALETLKSGAEVSVIKTALPPLLILAALTFFVAACVGFERSALTAISGTLTIVMFASELAISYRDLSVALNNPNKMLFHFTCLSAMFFLLYELRVIYGTSKARLWLFSTASAAFMLGCYSVPSIIAHLAGACECFDLRTDVAFAAIFLFVVVRMLTALFGKEEPEEEKEENESNEENEDSDDVTISAEIEFESEIEVEAESEDAEDTEITEEPEEKTETQENQ